MQEPSIRVVKSLAAFDLPAEELRERAGMLEEDAKTRRYMYE